jgi:hypothetical protein
MNNLNRYAYGNLLDAMDRCDPTRSHESAPSMRLLYAYRHRRFTRRLYGYMAMAAACVGLMACVAR